MATTTFSTSTSNEDLIAMARSQGPVDDSGKYGKPRSFDPTFHGPVKKRSCTDVICLVLLLIFICGWGVVGYFAFANGSWDRLLYPTDSRGRICGRKNVAIDLTSRPYLFYFDISTCLGPTALFQGCRTPSVCVEKCPNKTFFWDNFLYNNNPEDLICLDGSNNAELASKPWTARCASYYLPSRPIAGRCIPDPLGLQEALNSSNVDARSGAPAAPVTQQQVQEGTKNVFEARAVLVKVFSDFSASWWMILIAFAMTMVVSFFWIVVMRWVAGPMVWIGMLSVLALLTYAVYYCFTKMVALDREKTMPDPPLAFTLDVNSYLARRDTWMAFGIVSAVVLGILVLIGLFLRNRIRLAVALLQEASKGVSRMMCTLLFPIIPFILQLVVFGFWGLLAVLLSSAGEQKGILLTKGAVGTVQNGSVATCNLKENFTANDTHECVFGEYYRESMYTYFQLYNVFGLFWLGFFVVGLGEMALAGAFASFYWTRTKVENLPAFPLGASFGRCFRYHLGSIAFGSLIIAIVRFVRWILEQVDQKLKKSELGIARCLLKCCACCLWCLEKFLKFINRNAYIMVAIYGKNFCRSAKNAFDLLMRNILRVVVLDKVTDFLLFLGKLVIVGAVGTGSFFFFAKRIPGLEQYPPVLNYYYVPVITVIIGSYLIASAFFGVYAMAVDTLFLCFLEDLERNDGSPEKPYYMSKSLMKILGKKNKIAKKAQIKTTAA